jgi:hypothetical protein
MAGCIVQPSRGSLIKKRKKKKERKKGTMYIWYERAPEPTSRQEAGSQAATARHVVCH